MNTSPDPLTEIIRKAREELLTKSSYPVDWNADKIDGVVRRACKAAMEIAYQK